MMSIFVTFEESLDSIVASGQFFFTPGAVVVTRTFVDVNVKPYVKKISHLVLKSAVP